MGERRQARELALQCLYQWDRQGPDDGRDLAIPTIHQRASTPEVAEYAQTLLDTFWDHSVAIDERIAAAAEHWSVHRMAVVDRSILRLAIAELCHIPTVPPRVTIDEAIELAKKYSTERSGSFVNGILDRIMSEREESNGTG